MDVEYADLELNEDVYTVSEHFIDSVSIFLSVRHVQNSP